MLQSSSNQPKVILYGKFSIEDSGKSMALSEMHKIMILKMNFFLKVRNNNTTSIKYNLNVIT